MAIQSQFYATDGSTRTFHSTKHIATKQHCAVYMQLVSDSSWALVSVDLWDLINNSAVLDVAPDNAVYSQVEVRVADAPDELAASPSDITTVAGLEAYITEIATDPLKSAILDVSSEPLRSAILNGTTVTADGIPVFTGGADATGADITERPDASTLELGDTWLDLSTGMLYEVIDTGGGVLGWDEGVLISATQGISPWMFINTRNCVIQPYDGNTLSRSGMDISLNADLKVNFAYGANETGFVNQVYDFGQFDVSAITIPAVDDIYHIYIDETGTLGYKTGASFVSIDDDQDIDAFTGVADMYHIVEGMMYDRTSTTTTPVPVHRVYLGHAIVSGGTISTTSGHFVSKPRNITRAGILTASDYIKTKRAFAQEYNRGTETYIKFHEYTNMKFDVSGDVTFTMSAPDLLISGQTGIIEFVNTGTVTSLTFPATFYFPYEDSTKAARITPDLPLASGDRYMIAYYIGANKSVYVTDYQTFE